MEKQQNWCKNSNKKGSIIDAIPIMMYTFVFAIVVIFSFIMYDGLVDNGFFTILENHTASPAFNMTHLQENADTSFDMLDTMVLFVFIGTTVSSLIGAILIRSHPAFFFISIIVMTVQIFIGMILSNTWTEILANPAMADAATQFTIANLVISNFPVAILIIVILIAIVLYALNPLGVE